MHGRTRLGWLSLWLVLATAGCQCFVPVDERPDSGPACRRAADCPGSAPECEPFVCGPCRACRSGRCATPSQPCPDPDGGFDGGEDGGFDGGGGDAGKNDAGCARASQCTSGPQPTTNWCGAGAAYSCIANTCLWECPLTVGSRTCSLDGGCLACADAGTHCPLLGNCGGPTGVGSAWVEPGSLCATWPGTTIAFDNLTIARTASAQCRYLAYQAAGTQNLGEFWRLSTGEYLAYFPTFGGWCTGRSAFTGVPRAIFNCPACQFVLGGFE